MNRKEKQKLNKEESDSIWKKITSKDKWFRKLDCNFGHPCLLDEKSIAYYFGISKNTAFIIKKNDHHDFYEIYLYTCRRVFNLTLTKYMSGDLFTLKQAKFAAEKLIKEIQTAANGVFF